MTSGKRNEMTPLRSFLTQEILPSLQQPLFNQMLDFITFATNLKSSKWFNKNPKSLKCLVSNQMKTRKGDGSGRIQSVSNHYHHYKEIIIARLHQLGLEGVRQNNILELYDIAFRRHEEGEVAIDGIGRLKKTFVTCDDLEKVELCLKANGGKATLDEIFSWIKNLKD